MARQRYSSAPGHCVEGQSTDNSYGVPSKDSAPQYSMEDIYLPDLDEADN